jgi:hypothetical protein
VQRRDLLKAGAGVGGLGLAAYGGASVLGGERDPQPESEDGERLARRYAPRLVYDARERWFPTDPRPYTVERDGETVVDGFAALDGYSAAGRFPNPTVWYNVRRLSERLRAVQFWVYAAFDQFTVNFHWHDWELLQVFVDVEADDPVLFCASAHSRKVPNNEFLDPGSDRPTVLAELGSHSSATEVNDATGFQRFSGPADLTNRGISVADFSSFPMGYGLPRDEGLALPVSMPELDGAPVHEHPELPNVTRDDLVPPDATVRSFSALASPPVDLPRREPGPTFAPGDGENVDSVYELRPMSELAAEVDAFDGPQLSFEFAVPRLAENAIASHLTAVPTPWSQSRYESPLADVSDPRHRRELANRFGLDLPARPGGVVVGAVRTLTTGGGGRLRDAYAGNDTARARANVSLASPGVEVVALLESEDPVAVPSTNGVIAVQDVPADDHRLTVNGAGIAPYAEGFSLEGGEYRAGADGRVATVPNGEAVAVGGSASGTEGSGGSVRRLRVEEDFAGPLYDARPPEEEFAVYLHREGAYTVEIEDESGSVGVERVVPDGEAEIELDLDTGVGSVFGYLGEYLAETADLAGDLLREAAGATDSLEDEAENTTDELEETTENATGELEDGAENATGELEDTAGNLTDDTDDTTEELVGAGDTTTDNPTDGTANETDTATSDPDAEELALSPDSVSPDADLPGAGGAVVTALAAAAEAAARARRLLDAGNAASAQLGVVRERLTVAEGRLDDLPEDVRVVLRPRVERALSLTERAAEAAE